MKKLIMATVIAACLALCAAVWPSAAPVEELPAASSPPAVTATQPEGLEAPEIEDAIRPEERKDEMPHSKVDRGIICKTEPTANPIPPVTETLVITRPESSPKEMPAILEVQPMPESESASHPAPAQTADAQSNDTVYVPGFGWLESQGPGEVIHAEDIYENGNKIGSMG